MRIFPLALIAFGVFGVLKHYGLIDPTFMHLFGPLVLIVIGIALLVRGPRWWRADMHDRWERRMHRRFGPGWASLSEQERERFRAGMRQWQAPCPAGGEARPSAPLSPSSPSAPSSASSPAPGEQR